LRREDLEDCYSQAMLELVAQVRAGRGFANARHLANALEVRFNSRISDRRRALSGRSPMEAALETARTLADGDDGISVIDRRADVERVVLAREEVRRVGDAARELTPDQRVVLAAQLGSSEVSAAELCATHGWSIDKYRKVSQRARARLARLTDRGPNRVPSSTRRSVEGAGTAYDHRTVDP
jgi:DNA-directed RNA polymerase specialized sigma24 family protein